MFPLRCGVAGRPLELEHPIRARLVAGKDHAAASRTLAAHRTARGACIGPCTRWGVGALADCAARALVCGAYSTKCAARSGRAARCCDFGFPSAAACIRHRASRPPSGRARRLRSQHACSNIHRRWSTHRGAFTGVGDRVLGRPCAQAPRAVSRYGAVSAAGLVAASCARQVSWSLSVAQMTRPSRSTAIVGGFRR